MHTLLFGPPRLARIWPQLNVEGARGIIHEACADADQAPFKGRLSGALHIHAKPALLREAVFKWRWWWRVLLHRCSLEHAGGYSLRTMMCFATV